jgi:surface-anchored protein
VGFSAPLVALAGVLLTVPDLAAAQVLSEGHVDYAARLVDGRLRSQVKDGTSAGPAVWREPSSVTFSVGDAARTTVPSSAPFLGRPGDAVWVLPQVQRAGLLWAGWNTEELTSAQVDGAVTWSLDSVDGPGDVALFQTGVFGEADILFGSADGLPDSRSIALGTHAHGNWAFGRPGSYRLTFTMSARLRSGETVHDTQTLPVTVGTAPTPSPTPTRPEPEPTATPVPDTRAPGGSIPAAPVPVLRALSARLKGRTLHVRVRLDRRSRVAVTLRRGKRTSARARARAVAAGTRTLRLRLNRRPAAGRHDIRVTASAGGRSTTRTLTLRVRNR